MDSGIIDFKKQKFIRDCIEYLKTGDLPADLRTIINSSNPSYIEYLKKDNDDSTVKVIDTVINKINCDMINLVKSWREIGLNWLFPVTISYGILEHRPVLRCLLPTKKDGTL